MKLNRVISFFLFCSSIQCIVGAQSPWVRSKSGFYTQVSAHFIPSYDQVFGNKGKPQDLERKLSERTFQMYGEYGLSRKTTLVASLPIRTVIAAAAIGTGAPSTAAGQKRGLGNTTLSLRHSFYKGNVAISGTMKVDLPTFAANPAAGLRTGYQATTLMPMVNVGMGFRKAYWFAYGGYGLRNKSYSHVWLSGVEAGLHVRDFWLIAFSEQYAPVTKGTVVEASNYLKTRLFVNDQAYVSLGAKLIYQYNPFVGAVFTATSAPSAELLPYAPNFGIGVWFKWE